MAERKKYNFAGAAQILSGRSAKAKDLSDDNENMQDGNETGSKMKSMLEHLDTPENPASKAFHLKYVPREKLIFNVKNNYPKEKIEKLAGSILRFGLIHCMEVLYDEETDCYTLESGERRTRAIDMLIEKYKDYEDTESEEYRLYFKNVKPYADGGLPCNVKRSVRTENNDSSGSDDLLAEIESQIRLRIANEEVRDYDAARQRERIMELNDLYDQRNRLLSKGEKININETLSEELNLSQSQIKNYKATTRLIPELEEMFKNNNISLKEGASYAKLSEDEQQQIFTMIQEGGDKKEVSALTQKLSEMKLKVDQKEREIKNLEKEKAEAEKKADKEKRIADELKKKIEENSSNSSAEEVKRLQKQLQLAEKNHQEYTQKIIDAENEKANKIAELERQLAEKESKKATALSDATRAALQLENLLQGLKNSKNQFETALEKYRKVYDADASMDEMSPDEFFIEFEKIMKL